MARYDLLIINRSFWPKYPVPGEGLLRLAEKLAPIKKVGVVTQYRANLRKNLAKYNRGHGVNFFPFWSASDSSSNLFIRIVDLFFFLIWVIFCLIRTRPKKIYISTDPPIIIPFIVAIYSKITRSKYFYHIQDIHPEATNIIIKINLYLFKFLKKIDNFTIKNAHSLITLTEEMRSELISRSKVKTKILIIQNPAIPFSTNTSLVKKKNGFSFTGNLGRLQKIPLLAEAIKEYITKNGTLEFAFAGGGIYTNLIKEISISCPLIKYHGLVSAEQSALISSEYEWALLPIEDSATKYAFPSKASTYAFSGAKILAICREDSSISEWINFYKLGVVVEPSVSVLVDTFFKIEKNYLNTDFVDLDRTELKSFLQMDRFVDNLKSEIFPL